MVRRLGPLAIAIGLALPGCATLLPSGTPVDEVTVASEPAGAECHLERMSRPLGEVAATPGTVRIPRSSFPLDVFCTTKDGLAAARSVRPGVNPYVYLDLIGGGVPYVFDSMTDGDRTLPDTILVRFPVQH